MKGLVNTVEVIIASVILLIMINELVISVQHEPWGKLYMQHSLEDLVSVLNKENKINKFVMENDYNSFHDELETWIGGPYDFSIKIIGLPKPIIKVACICDQSHEEMLKSMLEPLNFYYNNRETEIRIIRNESAENIGYNENPDIYVYFSNDKFNNDKSYIENKLKNGKGVLLISNLSDNNITQFSDVFGFQSTNVIGESNDYNFYSIIEPRLVSFEISRIFSKTPFRIYTKGGDTTQTGNITMRNKKYEIKTFTNSTCDNCIEYPIDSGKYYKIWEKFNITADNGKNYTLYIEDVNANSTIGDTYADMEIINYSYSFNLDKGTLNNVEINENISVINDVNNKVSLSTSNIKNGGIATWIMDVSNNSDNSQLVKSLVMLTAGEEYKLDSNTFDITKPEKIPGKEYFTVDCYEPGYNGIDPYKVEVSMWSLFG